MGETVEPVVAKVPGERGNDPQRDAPGGGVKPAQRHVDQREMLQDEPPGEELDELREVVEGRAERPGAEAVDRVVCAIEPASADTIDDEFDEQCQQEKRYGKGDQVHARIVTRPAMLGRRFLR